MRFVEFIEKTNKSRIDESYIVEVATPETADLVEVFARFDKLTGNLHHDRDFITDFWTRLTEEEEFDPFSHLQDNDMIDIDKDCVLTLNRGNDKLQKMDIVYISLPAGYSCPFAQICKSMAHKKGGRFSDTGKAIKDFGDVRCFAATAEVAYPSVRNMRWRNFDLLRSFKGDVEGMKDLILKSIQYYEQNKPKIKIFRIHDSGDFFSQEYFDAWLKVAEVRNDILFYAYTKALPLWKERKDQIPKNLRLIASEGGTHDDLIDKEQFRKAVIVKDKGEAIARKLHIDVNEFLAAFGDQDFAMLLHGVQSAEGGQSRQARANSKIIKDAAKRLKLDPREIDRLFRYYTGPMEPTQAVQFHKTIPNNTAAQPVTDSVGDTPNVGDGYEEEHGATWDMERPHGNTHY